MTVLVCAGLLLGLIAPLLHRLAPRATVRLFPLYPAAGFVWLLSGGAQGTEQTAWAPTLGVELSFRADGLSRLFALLITGVGALVLVYAAKYMAGHVRLGRFYGYLLAFMASMLGLVFAENVIALFVFWELTSISSFLLIGFEQERPAARAAALQALYVTAGGGLALLAGLLLLAHIAGTPALSSIVAAADVREHALYAPVLLLVLAGAFTKSAQAPFHFWLPNAMEAPTPVSAYLHSSTMVKAGVYLLARLQPALGGTALWLILVGGAGAVTAIVAAVLAWRQTDLKRILAYSTVSALGMMTMLIGLGTDLALKAAVLLVLAHALYKGALFLVAGAIDHAAHERHVGRLGGLGRGMPFTAAAALLAALSMAGLPPLGGFLAKEVMLEAAWELPGAGAAVLVVLFAASALLGAAALLAGVRPFVGRPIPAAAHAHESSALWGGALLLGVAGAAAGLAPGLFADRLVKDAAVAIGADPALGPLVLWHGVSPPLLIGFAALAGAALLVLRWRAPAEAAAAAAAPGLADRAYRTVLGGVTRLAVWQTRQLQSGYLRVYLLITIGVTVLIGGTTLLVFAAVPAALGPAAPAPHEAILLLVILASALAAARSRSRLGAVAALGIVGYGVALVFVMYGAPDLAMTQFAIETLTVILFLFAFRGLPAAAFRHEPRRPRTGDAAVAGAAGLLMTALLVFATSAAHGPTVSGYFVENSVPLGHGRNIVNVILVDFRALDTLGEISVLGLAGVGVFALLRLRPDAGVQRR